MKTMLQDYIDTDKLGVGIAVGIVDTNGLRVIGHGKRANGSDGEVNGDTVFEIGSITKVFTALLLQDMVERGQMKLDDPIQKYLPDSVRVPMYQGRQITLLHLATHTSGLPRMPDNLAPVSWRDPDQTDYSIEQLYAFLSSYKLPRAPGTEAAYSNLGMQLLGHVIAQRAGTDYETLVLERICRPLGMDSTRVVLTPELESRLAVGHAIPGRPVGGMNFKFVPGAGGLHSTVNDLLKFLSAYLDLRPSPLNSLMQNAKAFHTVESGAKLMLAWGDDDTAFGHNGATYGYQTVVGFDPKQRRGFTVLSNCRSSTIVGGLWGPLRTAQSPKPGNAIALDPGQCDGWTGQYRTKESSTCTVRREGQRVLIQWIGPPGERAPSYEIFPVAQSIFRNEFWGVEARFASPASNRPPKLTLTSLGPYSGIQEPIVLDRFSSDVPAPAEGPIELGSEIYERYVGQYRKTFLFGLIGVGPILSIAHETDRLGNHLIASAHGVPGYNVGEFFPATENCFTTSGNEIRLTFLRNRKGKATRVKVYWDGRRLRGSRISDKPAN